MREWRYSSMVRWNASRSLRFTGTSMRQRASSGYLVDEHTVQDLAQLFDGQQPSILDFIAILLVAAQPPPEKDAVCLKFLQSK
jgi:hypothetical protein